MKNYIILFVMVFCICPAIAQDAVYAKFNEAKNSFAAGDLEDARYILQQSLAELDMLIGHEVLSIIPRKVAGLNYISSEDIVAGNTLGIAGSSVERNYKAEDKSIRINLMNDSPMLSMVTAFLTNPLFSNSGDGTQKQLKISGYKAVLQKNSENAFTLQIPLNQSLLTVDFEGFNEQETIKASESLNIAAIAEIVN